jgi:hypothetical protein
MSKDEVLAALREVVAANNQYTTWTVSTPHLVALVNLAIEREREECVKVCESWKKWGADGALLAKAIRARGQA